MVQELEIQIIKIKEAAEVIRAIDHQLRRQILVFLHQEKGSSVTPIYKKLGLEQSVTSAHLAVLRKARIVRAEKKGKHIYYSVNYTSLEAIGKIAGQL